MVQILSIVSFIILNLISHVTEKTAIKFHEDPGVSIAQQANIQRDSVKIKTSNGTIFGILFKPTINSGLKAPAVLCLQGGGDVGLTNYLYEAKHFAKNGFFALVCDKSGSGLSKTNKSWQEQSFVQKTDEYSELISWLAGQPEVDENKVGVHGMSEGGRLAINLAYRYPENVAFVNSVSGPIESFKENQLYAIEKLLERRNFDKIIIKKTIDIWRSYFDDVATGKISQTTITKINSLRGDQPQVRYFPSSSTSLPARPLSEDVEFSVKEVVNNIDCPVLFQYGELDALVDPEMSNLLIENKSNFTIKNYIDTDHSMNLPSGQIQPLFLKDKFIWLKSIGLIN